MRTLFLASAGIRFPIIEQEFLKLLPKSYQKFKVAFITTAYKFEQDTDFAVQDLQKLKELGFAVAAIDITGKTAVELKDLLQDKDIIYVEGGNAYTLLDAVNKSGFADVIKDRLDCGAIYFGVSAGSYIACPSIEMCSWVESIGNIPGLTDLTAMNLVPFLLSVHYNRPKYHHIREQVLQSQYPVKVLSDDQAILVRGDTVELVGKGAEIKFS